MLFVGDTKVSKYEDFLREIFEILKSNSVNADLLFYFVGSIWMWMLMIGGFSD